MWLIDQLYIELGYGLTLSLVTLIPTAEQLKDFKKVQLAPAFRQTAVRTNFLCKQLVSNKLIVILRTKIFNYNYYALHILITHQFDIFHRTFIWAIT